MVGLSFLAVAICYIDRVNISVAIIPMAEELGWDLQTRGIVLSSFFMGYLLLQIVGGRLADRFGGKIVLGAGVLLWSLFTILTPPAAFIGLGILLLVRIGMGMGEAVTFPAFYSLYGRWIPAGERARAVAFTNSGVPLGTVIGLVVTPIIADRLGWEWVFYLFGALGAFWYLAWHRQVTASPEMDPLISQEELQSIQADRAGAQSVDSLRWWEFLRHAPVWAIIVAHFCNNWSLYVLLSWLPAFVNEGLGVDFSAVGWVTMIPHLASFIFLNFAGNLADRLIARGMDVGRVRKLMQTIGFGGIAGSLMVVGDHDHGDRNIPGRICDRWLFGQPYGHRTPARRDPDGDHEYRWHDSRDHRRLPEWDDPSGHGFLGPGLPGLRRCDDLRSDLLSALRERKETLRLEKSTSRGISSLACDAPLCG